MDSSLQSTNKAFYKPEELAKAMEAPTTSVYAFIKQGRIKAIPWGTGKRIPAEEFERVLREGVLPLAEVERIKREGTKSSSGVV